MKRKKIFCYTLACFVALALLGPAPFAPVQVYAASFPDITGHWAEPYINSAINKGITTGYSDGTFKPDKPVTRAEFASMMNKALGNAETTPITFTDVPSSEWYYSDVSKSVAAAYVSGYDNNSFKPNNPITREEAAVMISRIVPGYGTTGNLRSFGDYESISDWALTGMQKSNGKGYVGAYNDGDLHPKDKLTRAQTVKIICDIIDNETIVSEAPSVKAAGINLTGKIYSNGVIIPKDLSDNSATIDNCVVMGDLTIQGGGSNSIVINNSRIVHCSVENNSSAVRVVAKGNACILNTDVSYTARLETSNLNGETSDVGFSEVNANRSSDLTLSGNFPRINLTGSGSAVKLESGAINTLEVSSSAKASDITVGTGSTIAKVNVNNTAAFHGAGTIDAMNANANYITYEKEPSDINIDSSVTTKPEKISTALSITFDPANETSNVAVSKKITITFSQAITKYDGKAITSSDLKNLIDFTKESKTGTDIGFSASISSSGKVITVTPDNILTKDMKYYVSFDKNIFKDESGDGNTAQSISFTSGSGSATAPTVTFSPADGANGVSAASNISVTFSEKIFNGTGSVPSNLNVSSSVTLRDNTAGCNITYTPYVYDSGSGTVFAINPVYYGMVAGHNYTVVVKANSFKNSEGNYAASASASFTVVTNVDVTALNTAIARAKNVKSGVMSSVDGSDVHTSAYWVTSSQMETLNNAISTATGALSTVQTTEAANAAAAALDRAVTAIEQSKKLGVKASVDTSEIDQAIRNAELQKKGVVISSDGTDVDPTVQWVTPELMKALNDAIEKAKSKKTTVQTSDEVTAVYLELNWASVKLFDLKKSYGTKADVDKAALSAAINNANNLHEATEISDDGSDIPIDQYWATLTELSAFSSDIGAAEKILNKTSATKAEVDNAISTISAATDYFEHSVRKNGMKASK